MEKKLPQEPVKLSQAIQQLRESTLEAINKKQTGRLIVEINIKNGGIGNFNVNKRLPVT